MSGEGPKLYANKPKKSKLKASTPITAAAAAAASSSNGASAAPPPPPPPPPPQPQKESFIRRYRFLWPLLLAANFAIGAYVLMRTRQKDTDSSESEIAEPAISTSTSSSATATVAEVPSTSPTIKEPIQRPPIPEDQQRQLFKWMLEEKRKLKPKDPEEKRRIDEEKAVLKQFIRARSIPNL